MILVETLYTSSFVCMRGYNVVSGDYNDFLQLRKARSINFWLVQEKKMIFILFAYRTLVSNKRTLNIPNLYNTKEINFEVSLPRV